ncbi:hypothetical protein DJFAAGMI_04520 [Comamonas sp. PE63]|uniref:Uncharacterized protein n=1 Tax=Comamonas brasiliensis TaxID=1812482 RepID=A0ABS5LZJ0_9BURK|nr:DUF5677 domain-containing protein [Comamonas sp. PE63]MBS3021744.1 hypothetical protein [Comamonas sp. PE63]
MSTEFEKLNAELPTIKNLSSTGGANGFFAQEVLRFHSLARTLLDSDFKLDESSTVDERYLTHVLSRSLLENCFTIIYLFDNPAETSNRYEALKNSFKEDYRKLLNEPLLPRKSELEPADPAWRNLAGLPNVNDMLAQVKNVDGDRMNYLYFVYRIASFDTHGRSLGAIFESVFGKTCNFPVLKIKYAFELMADQYCVVLNDLRSRGEI